MVTKVNSSKSTLGSLMYNEKKVASGQGKLLLAAGFPVHPENLDLAAKLRVFRMLTNQDLRFVRHTLHFTLNFSSNDILDELTLKRIANRYMSKTGFDKQPYLVYQHYDTMHAHLHIVSVKVTNGGKAVKDMYLGYGYANASREIEIEFGLEKAGAYSVQERILPDNEMPVWFHYGDDNTTNGVSRVVNAVLNNYKFSNIMEYDAILNQFGIKVIYGREGSRMDAYKGLSYGVVKRDGRRTSCPIKASALTGKPMLKEVEKRFTSTMDARRSYRQRISTLLENALLLGNQREFEDYLKKCGVRIVFNKHPDGRLYGAVYIDNGIKAAWHDFNLGADFKAAKMLAALERLPAERKVDLQEERILAAPPGGTSIKNATRLGLIRKSLGQPFQGAYAASELPAIDIITDFRPYKYASYQALAENHTRRALEKQLQNHNNLELE